ncbi:MAG: ATP-dependent helicase HrpB [Bacteroidetes bacterium QS_9_68_14]|nr:MAG: ATP-dependent helicase HrpB [Bacteroidetes bacterium QS_9_68_14]
MTDLPVEDVLPELKDALRQRPEAVLEAPTGAGKTTRVPLALFGEDWLEGQKLIVLEPRRLAARAAAKRMAHLLGEQPGQTVGYRVRMDTQVGSATRIEVVTEGILTRFLQDDPALEGVGGVVFDEFHERSLPADLGLALCLDARAALRPDLRLLAMSATLDAGPVARLLGEDGRAAPRIQSEGRTYPVEVQYADRRPEGRLEDSTARAVRNALRETSEGDVLVFLPGAGEIRRTERNLDGALPGGNVDVRPLFGALPEKKQDAAIQPSAAGRRKVVLSTDIAETSLTIEGVTVVVDSGFRRAPRFDAGSGMTKLETVRVSKASADQRKGRAGRTQPGTCYRLWTRHRQQHLKAFTPPAIQKADLAPLALELACWGASAPSELAWLDPPPDKTFAQAQRLLEKLGALTSDGSNDGHDGGSLRVTPHGRRMAGLGVHPRLAHLLLAANERGLGAAACDLAALLDRRDPFHGRGEAPDADLRLRLQALRDLRAGDKPREGKSYRVSRGALHGARKRAGHFRRKLGLPQEARVSGDDVEATGLLVALAYPDRLAQKREGQSNRFRLRSGDAATFSRAQLLSDADFLAAAHLGGRGAEGTIFLAAPVAQDDIEDEFAESIRKKEVVRWDGGAERVWARRQRVLGALVLKDGPLHDPAPSALAEALLEGVREEGLRQALPWTKGARRLQERLIFLHHHLGGSDEDGAWPDFSDEALCEDAEAWLLPHLFGRRRLADLEDLNLHELLKQRLTHEQRGRLGDLAPTHVEVPSGKRRPIDYTDPEAPVLAARIQELFGMTQTPRVAGGRVALTVHLLDPAQRPAQITQDLRHFWNDTYFEVKKDLQGRYPKHYWPEDPFAATPTHRVRPER